MLMHTIKMKNSDGNDREVNLFATHSGYCVVINNIPLDEEKVEVKYFTFLEDAFDYAQKISTHYLGERT